eukprot:gnl/TRDRNA2_/TRDRNA2_195626_c0_seq1.p1 gnl/TRDRNA2_/TRDRNA2_195626_c0~~gnl/TRDRNA2_/TRDRNA2_195626_c0_seq1.p1  ORF type:complete len:609 (-),score=140.08 gnl/TRDRNA2_/TRDRNA2_195626_c0_seq1:219-1772(-)
MGVVAQRLDKAVAELSEYAHTELERLSAQVSGEAAKLESFEQNAAEMASMRADLLADVAQCVSDCDAKFAAAERRSADTEATFIRKLQETAEGASAEVFAAEEASRHQHDLAKELITKSKDEMQAHLDERIRTVQEELAVVDEAVRSFVQTEVLATQELGEERVASSFDAAKALMQSMKAQLDEDLQSGVNLAISTAAKSLELKSDELSLDIREGFDVSRAYSDRKCEGIASQASESSLAFHQTMRDVRRAFETEVETLRFTVNDAEARIKKMATDFERRSLLAANQVVEPAMDSTRQELSALRDELLSLTCGLQAEVRNQLKHLADKADRDVQATRDSCIETASMVSKQIASKVSDELSQGFVDIQRRTQSAEAAMLAAPRQSDFTQSMDVLRKQLSDATDSMWSRLRETHGEACENHSRMQQDTASLAVEVAQMRDDLTGLRMLLDGHRYVAETPSTCYGPSEISSRPGTSPCIMRPSPSPPTSSRPGTRGAAATSTMDFASPLKEWDFASPSSG